MTLKRFAAWLFATPTSTRTWRVIAWWEARRIPFNLVIGSYGVVCLLIFFWAIATSGQLSPGEDAVEPLALLAAPLAINLLYTLGWLVEVPARLFLPGLPLNSAPLLLKLGLALGMFLITLPAGFWVAFRVFQMAGVLES